MKKQLFFNFKENPRLYSVPFETFYKTFDNKICEKEIDALINRYKIYNKDLLSIGSGTAHEEYWFCVKGDNRLSLFDIDESGSIEPKLKSMLNFHSSTTINEFNSKFIQYYIGDFLKFKKGFSKKFDILYLSSFTPDELRRGAIRDSFISKRKTNWWIKKFLSFFELKDKQDLNWGSWCDPFHKSVYRALRLVKSSGLVIIQSYCGGIDVTCNPRYLKQVRAGLSRHGVTLLDVFYLKESPGVNLIVGFFGNPVKAKEFYCKDVNVPLSRFHGRTTLNNEAVHLYSLS